MRRYTIALHFYDRSRPSACTLQAAQKSHRRMTVRTGHSEDAHSFKEHLPQGYLASIDSKIIQISCLTEAKPRYSERPLSSAPNPAQHYCAQLNQPPGKLPFQARA